MANDFKTTDFTVKSDTRTIEVSQVLLYVVEINSRLAEATGVDLVSAAGSAIDSIGVVKIVQSLGLKGRAYIKAHGGKSYLILKGSPNQRPILGGTRYLTTNPSVAHITISPKSLARGAARMTGIAFIAYTALNVVEALLRDSDMRLSTLLGTIAADVIKFFLAASLGVLAGAAVGCITMVAAGPVIAAIFVGLATSIVLDRIDREFGLSEKLVSALEKASDRARSPFEQLANEIARWERHLINQAIRNTIPY